MVFLLKSPCQRLGRVGARGGGWAGAGAAFQPTFLWLAPPVASTRVSAHAHVNWVVCVVNLTWMLLWSFGWYLRHITWVSRPRVFLFHVDFLFARFNFALLKV